MTTAIKHLSLRVLGNPSEGPLFSTFFPTTKIELIILAFHVLVHTSGLRTKSDFITGVLDIFHRLVVLG
jgi:hypothetical protein